VKVVPLEISKADSFEAERNCDPLRLSAVSVSDAVGVIEI
jgi:hypothetical protein